MDFTFKTHKALLINLQKAGYSFITFSQYLESSPLISPNSSLVILRHDVEQRYKSALKFAQIQNQLSIKGTYFFRIFNMDLITQIL